MKTTPKQKTVADLVGDALPQLLQRFEYLCNRWSDEREYEDFAEYERSMRETLAALFNDRAGLVSMTKRPFKAVFEVDGERCFLHATARSVAWGRMVLVPAKGKA